MHFTDQISQQLVPVNATEVFQKPEERYCSETRWNCGKILQAQYILELWLKSVTESSLCGSTDSAVFCHTELRMSKHIEDNRPTLDVVNERLCDRHWKLCTHMHTCQSHYLTRVRNRTPPVRPDSGKCHTLHCGSSHHFTYLLPPLLCFSPL